VVDGLKPGQRKILYCCFKRNLKKDIKVRMCWQYDQGWHPTQNQDAPAQPLCNSNDWKVTQLSSYVSEHAA
jgi:hypothetical protein